MTRYAQLLKDDRWHVVRRRMLAKAKWTCEQCGRKDTPLQVHHTYYQWGRAPWQYPDRSFKVLCQGCHHAQHHPWPWWMPWLLVGLIVLGASLAMAAGSPLVPPGSVQPPPLVDGKTLCPALSSRAIVTAPPECFQQHLQEERDRHERRMERLEQTERFNDLLRQQRKR